MSMYSNLYYNNYSCHIVHLILHSNFIWDSLWKKASHNMYSQQGVLRSAWASAQPDQNLCCLYETFINACLFTKQRVVTLKRLSIRVFTGHASLKTCFLKSHFYSSEWNSGSWIAVIVNLMGTNAFASKTTLLKNIFPSSSTLKGKNLQNNFFPFRL